MQTETIFSSYEPIRKYNDLLRLAGAGGPATVHIQPIDSFLIKQVIAYYPAKPQVIDLAADLTGGESTMLLTADPGVRHLYTTQTHAALIRSAFKSLEIGDSKTTFLDGAPDEPDNWNEISASLNPAGQNPFTSALFVLAAAEDEALGYRFDSRFEHLARLSAEPVVLVLPIGTVGESRVIEAALRFCALDSAYRFTMLRELSPFWGTSQLGVISRRENVFIGDILKRIQQLYQGNFDFVSLLEMHLGGQIRANMKISPEMEQEIKRLSLQAPSRVDGVRKVYHLLVPVRARLMLRDGRVAVFKRIRKPR